MAGQFLILMVFLDKFWFGPVGKVLDERDALIRSKLGSVKDNTGDVDRLAAEAQEILKASLWERAHPCRQNQGTSMSTQAVVCLLDPFLSAAALHHIVGSSACL
jgi:hypothetical protein